MTKRQKRCRKITAAFALLAMLSGAANAQPVPPPAMAIHNDSLMTITTDPTGYVRITYSVPRPAMAAIGVRPGMQLIEGRWIAPNQFDGTAVVFAPRCATVFPDRKSVV